MTTPNTTTAVLDLESSSYDSKMKKSGEVTTATSRQMEKAAKQAADAQAFAAKFAADAVNASSIKIVEAQKRVMAAQKDMRQANKLASDSSIDEASKVTLQAAALQRLAEARLQAAEAAKVQSFAERSIPDHASITQMQATSASVRALEGNPGIRAEERFLTTIPGFGAAAQKIFPAIGAGAIIASLVEMGIKIRDVIKDASELSKRLTQGFKEINQAAQLTNDAMAVSNDRIEVEIAKLEKKPSNGLQLAIDEARQSADKLGDSLGKDIEKVNDLLSKNQVNLIGRLQGQASTKDSTKLVTDIQTRIDAIRASYQETIDNATERGTTKENIIAIKTDEMVQLQKVYKDGADKISPILHSMMQDLDMFQQSNGGRGRDQSANVAILGGFMRQMQEQQKEIGQAFREDADRDKQTQLQSAKEAAEIAAASGRKKAEWLRNELEANSEAMKEYQRLSADMAKAAAEYQLDMFKSNGLMPGDSENLKVQGESALQFAQSLRESIELHREEANAIANSALQMAARTGQMSKLDAAQVLANLHTQDFIDELQRLSDQRKEIEASHEYDGSPLARRAALQRNQNATESLTTARSMQVAEDAQAIKPEGSSALVGFEDAMDSFVIKMQDNAAMIRSLVDSAISDVNKTLVEELTTRSHTGPRHLWTHVGHDLATKTASTGLEKLEGTALGALGFGSGAKPTGTKQNPLYVRMADALDQTNKLTGSRQSSSSSGGMLGMLKGLFAGGGANGPGFDGLDVAQGLSMGASDADAAGGGIATIGSDLTDMIPFMADGGVLSANTMAMVGEEGPELFMPGTTGSIVPNNKLGSSTDDMGGIHFHPGAIDARGATDPAAVDAAVQRGIMKAAPHIAAMGANAMREMGKRTPQSQRS